MFARGLIGNDDGWDGWNVRGGMGWMGWHGWDGMDGMDGWMVGRMFFKIIVPRLHVPAGAFFEREKRHFLEQK